MACVLHVSDLHFGKELEGSHKTRLRDEKAPRELAKKLYDHTRLLRKEVSHVDALIITGDLTDEGQGVQFDLAADFVTELMNVFDLSSDAVLVVPGNHDINWKNEDLKDGKQYREFRKFYKQIKKVDWHENVPTFIQFPVPGERNKDVVIFGFNSCQVENSVWRGLGLVATSQLDEMQRFFSHDDSDRYCLRLAALHHHVLPVHNYDPYLPTLDGKVDMVKLKESEKPHLSVLLNSSKLLIKCQENAIAAIFHGHSHAPYLATQTKYYHSYYGVAHSPALSTVIIGNGSVTTDNEREFPHNHFQIVNFNRIGLHESYAKIWSFMTRSGESIFGDVMQDKAVVVPTTIRNDITEKGLIEELNISLNNVLANGYTPETYDSILNTSVNWLNSVANSGYGCASICTYIPRLEIYRVSAKYGYPDSVKNVVYTLVDPSITATCAIENRPINVKRRKECRFASEKYDHLYLGSIGGTDQACLTVPLNSINDTVPYAIIGFARPIMNELSEYTAREISIVLHSRDIIENALKKAELAMTAHRRGKLLELYNLLYYHVKQDDGTIVLSKLHKITKLVYSYLALSDTLNEAVAIFLPHPHDPCTAKCVSQVGFEALTVDKLKYPIGKLDDVSDGLTGGIINSRLYDYCLDHLNPESLSKRLRRSSMKCRKNREPATDHLLSFVGVPLGQATENYNKGALVLNIATPMHVKDDTYIEEEYVKPLSIIATLLDTIIEGPWKECFNSEVKPSATQTSKRATKVKKGTETGGKPGRDGSKLKPHEKLKRK